MKFASFTIAFVIASLIAVAPLRAQRRLPAPSETPKVRVTIDLKVGGAAYKISGTATCEHLASGSIYDIAAERWSVDHSEGNQSLTLNLWRPSSAGGDMATIYVSATGKREEVDLIKVPRKPQTTGSGTVKFAAAGNGGTFTIDAKSGSGAAIIGTVTCEAFTPSRAVAGN